MPLALAHTVQKLEKRKRVQPCYTKEQKMEFARKSNAYPNTEQAARALGVSSTALREWRAGIVNPVACFSRERKLDFVEQTKKYAKLSDAAKALGIPAKTLSKWRVHQNGANLLGSTARDRSGPDNSCLPKSSSPPQKYNTKTNSSSVSQSECNTEGNVKPAENNCYTHEIFQNGPLEDATRSSFDTHVEAPNHYQSLIQSAEHVEIPWLLPEINPELVRRFKNYNEQQVFDHVDDLIEEGERILQGLEEQKLQELVLFWSPHRKLRYILWETLAPRILLESLHKAYGYHLELKEFEELYHASIRNTWPWLLTYPYSVRRDVLFWCGDVTDVDCKLRGYMEYTYYLYQRKGVLYPVNKKTELKQETENDMNNASVLSSQTLEDTLRPFRGSEPPTDLWEFSCLETHSNVAEGVQTEA